MSLLLLELGFVIVRAVFATCGYIVWPSSRK